MNKSPFGCFARFGLLLSVLLLACSLPPVNCQTNSSAGLLKQLESEKFTEISSTKEFPESVKSYYVGNSGQDISKIIADPGQSFEAGCVRTGKMPSKGLIVAAKSENLCLVNYQSGGIALIFKTDIFKLAKSKSAERIKSYSSMPPKNVEELLTLVRKSVKDDEAK